MYRDQCLRAKASHIQWARNAIRQLREDTNPYAFDWFILCYHQAVYWHRQAKLYDQTVIDTLSPVAVQSV